MVRTSWRTRRHFGDFFRLSTGMALIWVTLGGFSGTAGASNAPQSGSAPLEIPRPSRNWTPDGYNAAPEAGQLDALVRNGLAPRAAAGLTPAQRSLGEGPRNLRLSLAHQ